MTYRRSDQLKRIPYRHEVLRRCKALIESSILPHLNGTFDYRRELFLDWSTPDGQFGYPEELEYSDLLAYYQKKEKVRSRCLKAWMDEWNQAQREFAQWGKAFPESYKKVKNSIRLNRAELKTGRDNRAELGYQHTGKWYESIGRNEAAWIFAEFISGPLYDGISKCDRCCRYFINISAYRNKRYCTRQCSKAGTALQSTRMRRQMERTERIKKAKKGIRDFLSLKLKVEDPKRWVAEHAGITRKWLTQAINRGDLKPPTTFFKIRS